MKAPRPAGQILLALCLAAPGVAGAAVALSTDLAIGKKVNLTNALVGNTVVFQIGITNLGTNLANTITGSDVVPTGFSIFAWNSSGSPSAPAYNPTNGLWTLAALSPGSNASLTISTLATNAGTYTNTALISGASLGDPNPSNNSAKVVVTATTQPADLGVTKTAGFYGGGPASQFQVGDAVAFTITISNLGPGIPFNITGSDVVPTGFSVFGWSSSGVEAAPFYNPGTGIWTLGTLFPGHSAILSIFATAISGGSFTNTATITGASVTDPNPGNNSARVAVGVAQPTLLADLAVVKFADHSSVTVGDLVTFTMVVSNGGPAFASNVLVPEQLSPGWSFVGVSNGPNSSFDFVNQQWTILNLSPHASEVLALQAQAVSTGFISNRVDVIPPPGVTDPNPVNNTSVLVLAAAPPPEADLMVTKVAETNNVLVTNAITFDVTITNKGPNDAKNIAVHETLPSDLYIAGAEPPAGTVWGYPTSRSWFITNLAANAALTLKVSILPLRGGTFVNQVEITGSTPVDPVLANNTSSVPVTFIGYSACGAATLCSPLGGAPHPNATVTLTALSNLTTTATLTTKTDARGTFCLTNLLPGSYSLTVTPADPASGISTYQENVTIDANTGALAPWSKWLAITGVITFGPGGPPYPNVNVTVSDGTVNKTVATDQNGVYLVTGLAEKQYTVTPQAPAGMTSSPGSSNVTVGAAGTLCPPRADFKLQGALKIQGRLTACQGQSVAAYGTVSLSTAQFPNLARYNVGTDGRYTFSGLPPGQYTVTPTHPTFTFNPVCKDITLARANVVQNFAGTPNNGVIGGRIFSANRAPLAGVTVTARDFPSGANPRNTTTAADGTFSFSLPAGNYVITPAPAQAGFVFNPASAPGTVGGANPSCNNYVLFVGNLQAVEIVALEVVQVCQDWQNNIPLVRSKPTLVRAFLKPAGTSTNAVRVNGATLQVQSGTTTRILRPRLPGVDARFDYAKRRNDPAASLAFDLPTSLARGQVTLTLQWPGGILTTFQDPQQTAVVNNATTVTFQSLPPIPLKWVRVNWKSGATTTPAPEALVTAQRRRLLAGLPIVSLALDTTTSIDWEPPKDPATPASKDEIEELRNHLQTQLIRKRRADEFNPNTSKTVYHGVMTGTAIGGQAGDIPGKTSFADVSKDPVGDKNTPIHELGHVLGRHHAVHSAFGITVKANLQLKTGLCTEQALALAPDYPMDQHASDPLAPTLGPMQQGDFHYVYAWDGSDNLYISPFNGTADVMSYCLWTTKWVWPGSYSYSNMFNYVLSRFGPPPPAGAPPPGGTSIPCLLFSGEIETITDRLNLDPVLPVLRPELPPLPDPGPYTLLLLDSGSNILASVPFGATIPVIEANESDTLLYGNFAFEIPQITGVAAVKIMHQSVVLTNRPVPPHLPSVQFSSPSPGARLTNDPINVAWTAFHPDGHLLTFVLQYSADGGSNWETLALDLTVTQFAVAADLLRGTTNGYFQVTASDGFNATSAQTGPVTIPDHPPTVAIDVPLPRDVFTANEPIILRASARDLEDGDLADPQFHWTDSVSGDLGTGSELSVDASSLAPGNHTFTVTATDSAGHFSTTNVTVTVQRQLPVPLRASIVGDQIELSWPNWASTFAVWATFNLASPSWFLVEGMPTDDGENLILEVPVLEDVLYFRLAEP
jgi:uncharacterized repeat protein (TIGR01451 family)